MNIQQKTALNKLLAVYKEFYPIRSAVKANLFPYDLQEAERIVENIVENLSGSNSKSRPSHNPIREEIKNISTSDEVKKYISQIGLLGGQDESLSDNKVAMAITQNEYKHLYSIIYTSPISPKTKKEVLIQHIVGYFQSIERARALKP